MEMREIKFRAWDVVDRKMEEVTSINFVPTNCGLITTLANGGYKRLMQYTGLKDRNGQEVYEGDIVSWVNMYGVKFIGVIKWNFDRIVTEWIGYAAYDSSLVDYCDEMEVMGNIYTNPELLKVKEVQVND
jgi:uncharacterized phage protein (TIGR01671 family)